MHKQSRLKRPRYPMPAFMRRALAEHGLMAAYKSRPNYQQNDYVHWIKTPVREETRLKRLGQMLNELKKGGVYMNMRWNPKHGTK